MDVKKNAGIDLLKKKTPDLKNHLGQTLRPGYGANTGSNMVSALKKPDAGQPTMTASRTAVTKAPSLNAPNYPEGDAFRQAQAMLQQQMNNKPGEYRSAWQYQLDDTIQKILNREPFQYDLNGDALYQQYKDRYMLQGQQAMMDTMGQAQAMTGGYGNSYAQNVGQQAYHGYLQQLNDKVPELYQLALDKYRMEGDALQDQYSILARQEDLDYGRYIDERNYEYQRERDDIADDRWQKEFDYGKYIDDRNFEYGKTIDDRNYDYQRERDSRADEQWEREFEEAKRRFDQEWEEKYGTTSTEGGTAGGNGSAGGGYDAETEKIQQELVDAGYDVDVDGVWGPETQAAYDDYKNGGETPDGLPEANGSANAVNFVNSMMTREEARKRGITDTEYNSMVFDKINHANLTEGEIRYVLQQLCGFE